MQKSDAQLSGFAVLKKILSYWKKFFWKKIFQAYLWRKDLQNGLQKRFKNEWISRSVTFDDFAVAKNCSSQQKYY